MKTKLNTGILMELAHHVMWLVDLALDPVKENVINVQLIIMKLDKKIILYAFNNVKLANLEILIQGLVSHAGKHAQNAKGLIMVNAWNVILDFIKHLIMNKLVNVYKKKIVVLNSIEINLITVLLVMILAYIVKDQIHMNVVNVIISCLKCHLVRIWQEIA